MNAANGHTLVGVCGAAVDSVFKALGSLSYRIDIIKKTTAPIQNLESAAKVVFAQASRESVPVTMLGLLVTRGREKTVLAASCSHVLARSGVLAREGDLVEHPPLPAGSAQAPELSEFGRLTDEFTRLDGDSVFDEDFALAATDVPIRPEFLNDAIVATAVADPGAGFAPERQTLLEGVVSPGAEGQIINPAWRGKVSELPFVGDVRFESLVPDRTRCARGYSGAAVLDLGGTSVLGLHVAGSEQDEFGLFMPLWAVFQRLGLRLWPG